MTLTQLNDLIAAACPIDGINSDGLIFFKDEATTEERDAAQALMDANLPSLGETTEEQEKRAQRKAIADKMAESGVWGPVLFVVMESFIAIARKNYPDETELLSDEAIIAAVVDHESPFYNEGAKRVYDKYELVKDL